MLKISLRRKATQFSKLARESVLHRRTGLPKSPVLTASGELGITFIGHSSFFIQMGGFNVLIDPNYASWLVLLKRLRNPGLRMRDLPQIDVVLITHAHMDHMGDAIPLAKSTNPDVICIFELAEYLSHHGVEKTNGINKGGSVDWEGTTITMVDAIHSS